MAGPVSLITQGFKLREHPGMVAEPYLEGIAGGTIPNGAVIKNSGGTLVVAANGDAAEVVGVSRGAFTVGQNVSYTPFWQQLIWEATLDGGTTTGGVNNTLAVATHKWNAYGLGLDSGSGKYFVNFDDTSNIQFLIIGFVDPVGTLRGRVLVAGITSKNIWGI